MKRILCALIAVLLLLCACEKNPPPPDPATEAEAAFAAAEQSAEWMLYTSGEQIVALKNGISLGVFESNEAAIKALADNAETEADESVFYTAKPVSGQEKLFSVVSTLPSAPKKETIGATFTTEDTCVMSEGFTTSPTTYEAWIRLPRNEENRCGVIFGNYKDDQTACFSFEITQNGAPKLYFRYSAEKAASVTFNDLELRNGGWTHLVFINDPEHDQTSCYINGRLRATRESMEPVGQTEPARVGGDYRANNRNVFRGEIHSLAVYSDVRTAEEIQADMKTFGTDNLLAAWDLTAVSEQRTIADASRNGRTLSWEQIWFSEEEIEPVGDYDFSIAAIGDTQITNVLDPDNYLVLYNYLAEHKDELKLSYVLGLGDITDVDKYEEWSRAEQARKILYEAGIGHTFLRGNHDSSAKYNQTFNKAPYSESFDGRYGEGVENTYRKIEVCGIKYLILTMDMGAHDDILEWADGVIAAHPDHNVIITTHAYLFPTGELIKFGDPYAATNRDPEANNGTDIWEKLVNKHKNIVLVLSGHECAPYVVHTQTKNDCGTNVMQILSDTSGVDQDLVYAGQGTTGMITLFYFSEGGTKVTVRCYSAIRDAYYRAENQFTYTTDVIR